MGPAPSCLLPRCLNTGDTHALHVQKVAGLHSAVLCADTAPVGSFELLSGACLVTSAAALIVGNERRGLTPEQLKQHVRCERQLLNLATCGGLAMLLVWGRALEAAALVGPPLTSCISSQCLPCLARYSKKLLLASVQAPQLFM